MYNQYNTNLDYYAKLLTKRFKLFRCRAPEDATETLGLGPDHLVTERNGAGLKQKKSTENLPGNF